MPLLEFTVDTRDFRTNLVGTYRNVRNSAHKGMRDAAIEVIQRIIRRIEQSEPSGQLYYITRRGYLTTSPRGAIGTHQASAPGQPPAILWGNLIESFGSRTCFSRGHTAVMTRFYNTATGPIGENYAHILEYGRSRSGWGPPIAPRPFMGPVILSRETHDYILRTVVDEMTRAGWTRGRRRR